MIKDWILSDTLLNQLQTFDNPDSRDYSYEKFFMNEYWQGAVKKVWDRTKVSIWNQFDDKTTYKACTVYASWILYNAYNIVEYSRFNVEFNQVDPKFKRHQFQETRWRPNTGSSLQTVMRFFRSKWWIDWWLVSETIEWTKNAIKNWFLIYTGSDKCDWNATGKSKVFVYKNNWSWHAFSLVDYNDDWFIAVNSFGKKWWDEWYFLVPYNNFNDLYTKNVIIDKDDTGIIKNLNYENEYKKAIEMGITNGLNPEIPTTRKECAVMAYRVYKKIMENNS